MAEQEVGGLKNQTFLRGARIRRIPWTQIGSNEEGLRKIKKKKNTYTQNTKEAFEISVTHNEERRRDKLNTQKTC